MDNHKRVVAVSLLLTVGLSALTIWWALLPKEPVYKGKGLTQWLEEVSAGIDSNDQVKEAIRQMGPATVPYLVREIGATDPAWWRWVRKLAEKQTVLRLKFTTAEERRRRAQLLFPEVAAGAGFVVPALIKALRNGDPDIRMRAANCLEWVLYRANGEAAIPALVAALGDPDGAVRKNAASALGTSRYSLATNAVPGLRNLLSKDEDWRVRVNAVLALGEIRPLAPATVPVLISALRDKQRNVRHATTEALGKLGSLAKDAEPELRRLMGEDDSYVSDGAGRALRQIMAEPTK
jgi:HEAT repeat protein